FQLKVWQALLASPFGQSVSYGQVAARIGKPAAARAVGSAVGCNPIGFLIPCHRVVCASGALGGYRWGPDRKRALRAWEQAALKANRTPGFNQEPRIRSSATGYP
uniref:methylated-DNA--[protein]-cysteine S-methyltransferase n=1 Tax=Pontiella sp. TaxID=2837462 RepID=UPI003566EB0E